MTKRIRRGDSQRQRYWEEIVRRCRESGQSVRAFCRAEGLRESAFYFWRRELAQHSQRADKASDSRPETPPAMPAAHLPKRQSPHQGAMPSFLPVRVLEPSVAEAAHGVEIILGQGRTVRVRAGFDRQTLADVLAVLEVRPC
jgi:transposase-like protein